MKSPGKWGSATSKLDPIVALFERKRGRIRAQLEYVKKAYQLLGKPASAIPTVLVGGTNGKGTTSGFLALLCQSMGTRTGLYTSPHLNHYTERFWIDGRCAASQLLIQQLARIEGNLPRELFAELTFFEVMTLVALCVFENQQCQRIVIEVGMGGRWDATNIVDPELSILTGVSWDHQEFLGTELLQIALQKAGIARPHRYFVCGRGGELRHEQGVLKGLQAEVASCGAKMMLRDDDFGLEQKYFWMRAPSLGHHQHGRNIAAKQQPLVDFVDDIDEQLPADYLRDNLATALAAWFLWTEIDPYQAGSIVRQAIAAMRRDPPPPLRGRFQSLSVVDRQGRSFALLLDVCHNVDGATAFANGLLRSYPNCRQQKLPAMVSILSDKDHQGIMQKLTSVLEPVALFRSNSERSWSRTHVPGIFADVPFYERFAEAWFSYADTCDHVGSPLVICGSVAVLGEVFEFFEQHKFRLKA